MFSKYCTLYDVALISGQSQKSGLWQKPVEDWHVTFTYRLKPPTRPAIRWLLDVDSIWWPWGVHSHFECTKEFWAILTYREIFRGYLVGGLKHICLIFTPKIGEDEPILTNIFQMGGWNHRPGTVPGALNPRIPRFVMPASGERALGHQACPCVGVRASEVSLIVSFKGYGNVWKHESRPSDHFYHHHHHHHHQEQRCGSKGLTSAKGKSKSTSSVFHFHIIGTYWNKGWLVHDDGRWITTASSFLTGTVGIQSSRRSTPKLLDYVFSCFFFTLNVLQFVVCAHRLHHVCQVSFILRQDDQRKIWHEASVLFFTNTNINNLVVVSTSSYLTIIFRKIYHDLSNISLFPTADPTTRRSSTRATNDTGIFSAIPCSGGVNDEWHFTCICYEVHFFARLLVSIGQGPKSFLSCESVASTFLLGRGTLKFWSQTSFAHSYLRQV